MELILKAYDLKLKHTFTISRKSIDVQPCVIVTLKEGEFQVLAKLLPIPIIILRYP